MREIITYTVEPLYNEVLGITNDIFSPVIVMFMENNLDITKPVIANKLCQSLSPSLYRGSTISPKAACIQERMS